MSASTTKYIKISILIGFLFAESLFTTAFLYEFSLSQNYFTPDLTLSLKIFFSLLFLAYTYSLTVGIWKDNLQYLVIPLPIALGIFLVFVQMNVGYAILGFVIIYLIATYDVWFSTHVSQELIRFRPKIILRNSTKGILFIFAMCATVFILLNPEVAKKYDIAETIAGVADEQYKSIAKQQPELQFAQSFGFFNVKETVKTKVNQYIEPYKHFVVPILALATLGFVQFINVLVYLIFSLTVDPLFYIAKKTGFLHQEFIDVKKENLSF